jgi:SAM-dependent methyltransferase
VVDIGCGVGSWADVFNQNGVADVWGVDGDYVDRTQLQIPEERFVAHDLRLSLPMTAPFAPCDLVVCLEVAEHLPDTSAETLVQSLTSLAPVVVFSAAIPYQQGANHINCQWPDYWADLFARWSYVAVDALRSRVWTNSRVNPWYAQNMIVYVREESLISYPHLVRIHADSRKGPLSLVHPALYVGAALSVQPDALSVRSIVAALPGALRRAALRRWNRFTQGILDLRSDIR